MVFCLEYTPLPSDKHYPSHVLYISPGLFSQLIHLTINSHHLEALRLAKPYNNVHVFALACVSVCIYNMGMCMCCIHVLYIFYCNSLYIWYIFLDFLITGADFSLRDLGFGEAVPSHVAAYRTDMGLPHRDYSVSVGSDADTETDGIMSPEHAVRLWGRQNTKSGRSSCLSSRANSNLTLTDTEHENTENGKAIFILTYLCFCVLFFFFFLFFWLFVFLLS